MNEHKSDKDADDNNCIYEKWWGFLAHPVWMTIFSSIIIIATIVFALPILMSARDSAIEAKNVSGNNNNILYGVVYISGLALLLIIMLIRFCRKTRNKRG